MVGRDLLTLKDFTQAEIGTLLWTAMDLKTRIRDNKEVSSLKLHVQLEFFFCQITEISLQHAAENIYQEQHWFYTISRDHL